MIWSAFQAVNEAVDFRAYQSPNNDRLHKGSLDPVRNQRWACINPQMHRECVVQAPGGFPRHTGEH